MRIDGPQITGSFSLNGDGVQDLDSLVTTSSLNTYTSSMETTMGHVHTATHSLNTFTSSTNTRLNSIEGVTGSYATTGSNIFVGNQSITGSLTVSGSSTFTNIGPAIFSGSVTVPDITIDRAYGSNNNGDPIIIIRNTNAGNGITFNPNESDNFIEMSTGGTITAKGLTVSGSITAPDIIVERTYGSNNNGDPIIIIKNSSLGNGITFNPNESGNIIQMNTDGTISAKGLTVTGHIEAQELRTTYISSSILYRSGSTKFGDELTDTHAFTGSLLVSGSISVPNSGLVSGSSQVLNGSGVWSGSAQLPSGVVSGSAQVLNGTTIHSGSFFNGISVVSGSAQIDVLSTTNIARLATTGSNTFTSNQIVSGTFTTTGNFKTDGVVNWNGTNGALSYGGGAVTMETNTATPILIKTNGTTAITVSTGQTVTFASDVNIGGYFLTGIDKGIRFDSSGASGHPEISIDSNSDLNFKNTAGTSNLILKNSGNLSSTGVITTTSRLGVGISSDQNYASIFVGGDITSGANQYAIITDPQMSGTNNYAIFANPRIKANTSVTNTFGVYIPTAEKLSGASITNSYALYIANQTSATSTNYSIYSSGGLNYLGGNLGIGKAVPTSTLDIQSSGAAGIVLSADSGDTNNSGRMFFIRTGGTGWTIMNNGGNLSFRSDGQPGNTSGTERMRLDSSYNLILNNALTVAGDTNHTGDVRMNSGSAGNSPKITFGTEDESVPGNKSIYLESYWIILQPHVNEGMRVRFVNPSGTQTETVRFQSSQTSFYTSISSSSSISASGNLTARNFSKLIKSWAPAGSTGSYTITTYNWADELAALSSNFDSAGYYKGFIRSGNGAHYNGYHFDILVGSIGYGGNSLQFKVQNITPAHSPWAGGCGPTPFGTIDNTSFEHRNNPCGEYLELFITKLGG